MKRVLLVPDTEGWAWWKRAQSLKKYAPSEYDVTIIPQRELTPDMPDRYDGTLVFSWPDSPVSDKRVWTFVANEGLMYPHNPQAENYVERTASRSKNKRTAARLIPRYRGVITINHRTVEFLDKLNPNTHLLRTGVDCDVFRPLRPVRSSPPYRIGWCGKSFDDPAKWTPKGYHEVLVPLMKRFEGDERIEWVVNRRSVEDALSESEMVDWYNDIDLLLITSCSEGTPSVFLEAMACGRNVLSTPVGISTEVIGLSPHYVFWSDNYSGTSSPGCLSEGWSSEDSAASLCKNLYECLEIWCGRDFQFSEPSAPCRQLIESHFNWNVLATDWLELICT